uniref:Uncharacterized protein n=1 Tax=uncultured Desulfobacterium sp. TaxID=201089 RepID=E1YAU5_9BACT|nr:unknown protein [uncultured Desulfobacterium sp.]
MLKTGLFDQVSKKKSVVFRLFMFPELIVLYCHKSKSTY